DMMLLALSGDWVPFAVNVNAAEANETIKPFLPLAERLGRLFASLIESDGSKVTTLEINAAGEIGGYDIGLLSLSAQKGYFGASGDEQITYVNAPQIAKQRGVEVKNSTSKDGTEYKNLVTIRGGGHSIAATLTSQSRHARIVMIDDHVMRVPPAENMLIVRNDDRPGVIGRVGTVLGDAGVNIDNMDVGKTVKAGSAMMVIATATPTPSVVVEQLRKVPGIVEVLTIGG
ncbi:MAG: ACT domain-containing protein, partial [Actinomycetota bacterium]